MAQDKVIIFDTTLRDGEQVPGASLTKNEKIQIALQLEKLGVDVIEAGFPMSSPGDLISVAEIAKAVKKPIIAGLCRAVRKDIDACREAFKKTSKGRIHTFIGTSPQHVHYITRTTEEEVLRRAIDAVKYARNYCGDVEFSAMDATRTDFDYLCRIVEEVIKAGARTVDIPDSVGYAEPYEYGNLIKKLMNTVPNINKAVIAVHCHNDLGMATANSLMAVLNGARQVECTINGLGERAGNAALEEIVMAMRVRKDIYKTVTNINTEEIYRTSKLVTRLTGMPVQPNKSVVGENAFAHASGIHQDAILKHESTFGIMTPQDIGIPGHELVLTARSGKHALQHRLNYLGYKIGEAQLPDTYAKFLTIADKKKEVFDEDLVRMMEGNDASSHGIYNLDYIYVATGNKIVPTATLEITKDGKSCTKAAIGDGPVDAMYKAINEITGETNLKLTDYQIKAVTKGTEAMGEVTVRVAKESNEVTGRGASTDILEASAKAYLSAITKLSMEKKNSDTKKAAVKKAKKKKAAKK
ncbi:MAG: 2-isopropylmalate synthase [Candidatus Goldbacteria bacterium]|nr:2-isopropylmalate synthase [Candidatus Goldiibacteriota bacterium]